PGRAPQGSALGGLRPRAPQGRHREDSALPPARAGGGAVGVTEFHREVAMTTYGRWTTLGGVGIALLALACTDTDIASAPRAAAPTTGVRLILYAIDPLTQRPSSPPVEIGYADLIDNSSGGTTTLEVIIVGTTEPSPETYGDYTISGTFGGSSAKGTAAGYVTDGATWVDFTMSLDASSTKTTFNSVFDVGPQGVHITFDATMVPRSPSTLTVAVDFHMS